jgi:exopolyphosphatase / guanosine-5'-triphosphate,3'-diphosphate pyrophosphatase
MRAATIDIGTNTVLLLVVDRQPDGSLVAVDERATITRLGQGVDTTRRLSAEGLARTTACLDEYASLVQKHRADRVAIVGTSAMRDAGGSAELSARIEASFGVPVRIISGDEEARLTFRGALAGLPIAGGVDTAVFDIGGGSTEVVLGATGATGQGAPRLDFARSFDVGSVRLTERHVRHDPPTVEEREAVSRAAEDAFRPVPALGPRGAPVGIAGTMTTLAAVSLGLTKYDGTRVHGHAMSRTELRRVVRELAAMPLEARRRVPGMEPKRADVIVAGGLLALALLDHWDTPDVVISDRGVRWGLAEELLTRNPQQV